MKIRFCRLLLCCLCISPAFAGVITFLSSPGAPVDTVNWAQLGADGTAISPTFTATSASSVSVSGTLGGADGLTSVVCPATTCSWSPQLSGYSAGDTLIWAEDTTTAGSGPISLSFAAQFGIGAYLQATSSGAFTANLALFNGATLIGSQTYTSDTTGDPLFLGATDTSQEITRGVFSVTSCGSFACDPTDFSMDTLQIYGGAASAAPEPATFWLAGALLALSLIGTRKQERNRE